MKKLLLPFLAVPLLAHAAQWVGVGSGTGSQSFIDKASIVKSDAGYKVWSLVSYATEQTTRDNTPHLSMKALHVYSCKERTITLLSQVYYGEAMGKGPVAHNFKYEKFSPEDIIPDSVHDDALHMVCKGSKKK